MIHFTVFYGNAAEVSQVLVIVLFFFHYSAEFYIHESSFISCD